MPRAAKNGPGWAHEFGSLSVEWVVGALGEGFPPPPDRDLALQYSCLENPMDGGAW